jgi:hypothetical protein
VLRIFGPKKKKEVFRMKNNNDELHNLHSSPNIIRVSKSRRMRGAGHVAHIRAEKCIHNFSQKN